VVGGLVVSTIFTLFLVPMLLSLVFDAQALLSRRPKEVITPEAAPAS
jgi:hypothetical protein